MGRTRHLLTIDLGSGGPKVALVSEHGAIAAARRAAVGLALLPDGGAEQDPNEWWRAIDACAREVLSLELCSPDDIVAVACAAQWSVTVPVDREGQVIAPAVHWMDARGGPHARRLMDGLVKISGYEATRLARWLWLTAGVPTHSGADGLSHLLHLKHDRPNVYRAAYKFLEPCDYLGLRLTGRFAASYASIFPYFLADNRDCSSVRYSDRLLAIAGIDKRKLPELLPVDAVLGPILPGVARDWGLSPSTRVVLGMGDSHAAVLGSGAIAIGQPHLCIGTSSWMTGLVPRRRVDVLRSLTTMPSAIPGRNMLVAEQGPAGKLLELVVERWFGASQGSKDSPPPANSEDRFARLLEQAARTPAGSGGVLCLPWFNGAGPPQQDAEMRGGFLNLSLRTDAGAIVRSVLEGVAFNLRWLSGPVERMMGRPIDALHFIGGGARSDLWCQIVADVLGRPIHRPADPEYAIVRGAALAAMLALGMLTLDAIPSKVGIARTFEPDPAHRKVYEDLYQEFRRAHRTTRPLFHRWARGRALAGAYPGK